MLRTVSLLLLCTTLLFAGCATRPPPQTVAWPAHREALADLDHWRLSGKIGYRSPDDNGSAWLRWQQTGEAFELTLSGPFGAGAARIEGGDHYAILHQPGREAVEAASATDLTVWLFGLQLPVEPMREWIKGIPAGNRGTREMAFNEAGQLATLEQDGWRLSFSDYRRQGQWVLPGKIRGGNGSVSFTLVINSWEPDLPGNDTP